MKTLHVILGPTASGKTAYSIAYATSLRKTEIVNADSRQLYKFLDIGTAKITKNDMQGIPHHLLDILDPKEEATAAWYQKKTVRVIEEIHERGNIPILVGGSMLYISAVIDGLEFPGASDPKLREKLTDDFDRDGPSAVLGTGSSSLYEKLLEIDPDTALAFSKNNKPYVVRAMEIYLKTGKKPSNIRKKSAPPYELTIIGIERPREELHRRINERTKELFEKGWVEEVQDLIKQGYTKDDPGMKSHGYREIMRAISDQRLAENTNNAELQELISAKTRQYAKRQLTWWRRDKRIQWISP